jgi:hypothetical protein
MILVKYDFTLSCWHVANATRRERASVIGRLQRRICGVNAPPACGNCRSTTKAGKVCFQFGKLGFKTEPCADAELISFELVMYGTAEPVGADGALDAAESALILQRYLEINNDFQLYQFSSYGLSNVSKACACRPQHWWSTVITVLLTSLIYQQLNRRCQ